MVDNPSHGVTIAIEPLRDRGFYSVDVLLSVLNNRGYDANSSSLYSNNDTNRSCQFINTTNRTRLYIFNIHHTSSNILTLVNHQICQQSVTFHRFIDNIKRLITAEDMGCYIVDNMTNAASYSFFLPLVNFNCIQGGPFTSTSFRSFKF